MTQQEDQPTAKPVPVRGRLAWALVALVVVAALVQVAVSAPVGSSTATPDSVATCNFLFPHAELPADYVAARAVEQFRHDCERGQALPR